MDYGLTAGEWEQATARAALRNFVRQLPAEHRAAITEAACQHGMKPYQYVAKALADALEHTAWAKYQRINNRACNVG